MSQLVLIDDATPALERLLAFQQPSQIVRADESKEVEPALTQIEAALAAGWHVAGYFSYELGLLLEPRLRSRLPDTRPMPLLWFGVFDAPEVYAGADAARFLEAHVKGRGYAGPLRHEWGATAYNERFARVHRYIADGDIYQANLSFRSRFAFAGDAMALYRDLRSRSAAAHGAFVDDGTNRILSLSPELFFETTAEGRITARPMKGTAPRGRDAASDAAAREALRRSEKDRAENLMIVDLLRNDLGRIAATGSVEVGDLFTVETYPTLHTMVSTVRAALKPRAGVREIVRAIFPCGSVTGAPKIRTMEIIADLEASPRGIYCGAIGYFAPDGAAHFNVAIRTLTLTGDRGELGIGGAVVQDSSATGEYEEALLKARYYETAHKPIGLIETLRWEPDTGFVRLDRHLARMRNSAAVFGLPFDEDKARGALAQTVLYAREVLRVRLTLDEDGAFACTAAKLGPPQTSWRYLLSSRRVSSGDVLLRHKTTWREMYEAEAVNAKTDEVIFQNERGEITEGSRSNVFVRIDGKLLTPPPEAGLLDGILRREMLDEGACAEATLTPADLERADEVWLGNSLRGLVRAIPARVTAVKPFHPALEGGSKNP
ncbi:MAG TPA: aminodeoxychorismate synthase component I [Rhizomicrobium sp.]|jgi:para-aminobenzoate synthetase/4-amino-4-deoxychorismate lyase